MAEIHVEWMPADGTCQHPVQLYMIPPPCIVPGCRDPRPRRTRGMCDLHYQRWRLKGDVLADKPSREDPNRDRQCSIEECKKLRRSNEMCEMHYVRWKKHGDPSIVLVGSFVGDEVGYVGMHQRLRKVRGTPRQCEGCGLDDPSRRYEWALKPDAEAVYGLDGNSKSRAYSLNVDDYERLCVPCHRTQDDILRGGVSPETSVKLSESMKRVWAERKRAGTDVEVIAKITASSRLRSRVKRAR